MPLFPPNCFNSVNFSLSLVFCFELIAINQLNLPHLCKHTFSGHLWTQLYLLSVSEKCVCLIHPSLEHSLLCLTLIMWTAGFFSIRLQQWVHIYVQAFDISFLLLAVTASTFSSPSAYPLSPDFDPLSLISSLLLSLSCQTFCPLSQLSPCPHETLLPWNIAVFSIHTLCDPNSTLWPLCWVWVCVSWCSVQAPPLGVRRKGEGGEEGDGEMLLGEGRAEEESCRATSFS